MTFEKGTNFMVMKAWERSYLIGFTLIVISSGSNQAGRMVELRLGCGVNHTVMLG